MLTMKSPVTVSQIVVSLLVCLLHITPVRAERPNIVLIFADDLGWQEPTFAGSDFCETPHLDRLASEGMVFRHAYSSAGNCQPSRACMLSGQYTPRHDVYAVGSTKRGPVELMRLLPIPNKGSLPLKTGTMGEAMKAAGYATGLFGKCHLKDSKDGKSERAGFDVVKVSQHGLNSDDPADPKGIFAITTAACDFIEANREGPFFAYVSHYAVHSQLQGRPETLRHFKSKAPGDRGHGDPLFAACLRDLDTAIGRIREKLNELGVEQNTLIVFTSDNGGTHVSQEPLRGKKGCYYEGGIRVPMIAHWPGVVRPGSTCDVPVLNTDFFPTFLDVAEAELPSSPLDGASLVPLLQGESKLKRDAIFWHFPGYLNGPVPRGRDPVFRTRPVSVIRKGDWKLHLYHEEWQLDGGREQLDRSNAAELYNISADPGEQEDLAMAQPDRRDELLDDLLAWMQAASAKLPSQPNPQWKGN
jgi:arylsulfatase A-like enzyme